MKCRDKRAYLSKRDALTAINAAWKRPQRRNRPKTPIRAYYCPACSHWHLTHAPEDL